MEWFKIFLLILYGMGVITNIAKAQGWRPKPLSPGWHAFGAVADVLIFLGIWFWL